MLFASAVTLFMLLHTGAVEASEPVLFVGTDTLVGSADTVIASADTVQRPKVALVLCGGGAKGAAHIGVLKVLEEVGIRPDMVVGTSIGGIIGGLYSMGHNAAKIDSVVRAADWQYLLGNNTDRKNISFKNKQADQIYLIRIPFYTIKMNSDNLFIDSKSEDKVPDDMPFAKLPSGLVNGQNVYNMLTGLSGGYQDYMDFKDLPIPFACVATDLSTGEEVILDKGIMPQAMRATMAIPGYFTPISIDDRVLIDGGVVNNFPVDVARRMGADIVIGVDIQDDLFDTHQLKSITEVFTQIVGLMGNERYRKNLDDIDYYIKPSVEGFHLFSFTPEAVDSLITNGYNAANAMRGELEELAKKLNSLQDDDSKIAPPVAIEVERNTFDITSVEFNGVTAADGKWLLRKSSIREGETVTGDDINKAISIFYGTNAFSSVSYKIVKDTLTNGDRLILDFVKGPSNVFSVGARFDSEEAAAILLDLGIGTQKLFGSQVDLTGRLSYNAYGKFHYSYVSKSIPKINLSYMFKTTDMNIYERGTLSDYLNYFTNKMELYLSNMYFRNYDISAGIRLESYKYRRYIDNTNVADIDRDADWYLSYFFDAKMDNRDSKLFPTSGAAVDASISFFQPNFNRDNNYFTTLKFNASFAASLSDRFTLLPAIYYRSFIGAETYTPYLNFAGGSEYGRYVSQQIPFIGINYAEIFDSNILVGRLDARQRIGNRHYLFGVVNYMRVGNLFEHMFDYHGEGYWGTGVRYSYYTPLGPIGLDVHWSDYNKKVGLYLNIGYYF